MRIERIEITKINPAKYNPRKDLRPGDPEYEKLKKSIQEFDIVEPLVWNERTGNLVGGHQRLKILEELGHKEAEVSVVDMDEQKEKALNIALNKISGEWDMDKLKDVIEDLSEQGFDLDLTGFDASELDDIMADLKSEDEIIEDEVPDLPEEPVTKPGDLWILGRHRLLCGDSTKAEDVERLMDGKKADMVFTDPPYGIDKEIQNDNLKGDEFIAWNRDWISIMPVGDGGFICYHSTRTFPMVMFPALECGWRFERMLWFHRPDKFPVHTWNGWMLTSQAILVFGRGDVEYKKVSPADQDYYRCTSKDLTEHSGHPTEKIVSHLADVMKHYEGNTIYEPFCGSGSTLIAAEQLNRICYMMELDPKYCDVIVERWENLTGQKAVLADATS